MSALIKRSGAVLTITGAVLLTACASPDRTGTAPLSTVPSVDLAHYAGQWYEIARYPNRFQSHCAGDVTATYARQPDGTIGVANACRRADGSRDVAQGTARVVDESTNARLEVRFAPAWLGWLPFVWGDYWVLYLSPDYRVAIVGEPSREYLWILARTPTLADAEYEALMPRVRAAGYDPGRLRRARAR